MILPTYHGRIPSLDHLRGAAVLGILLANMPAFAYPISAELTGQNFGLDDPASRAAAVIQLALVKGKCRSMRAILFGVGVWLQLRARSGVPGSWPGSYMRRVGVLAAIGLLHGFFLWYGDIL